MRARPCACALQAGLLPASLFGFSLANLSGSTLDAAQAGAQPSSPSSPLQPWDLTFLSYHINPSAEVHFIQLVMIYSTINLSRAVGAFSFRPVALEYEALGLRAGNAGGGSQRCRFDQFSFGLCEQGPIVLCSFERNELRPAVHGNRQAAIFRRPAPNFRWMPRRRLKEWSATALRCLHPHRATS